MIGNTAIILTADHGYQGGPGPDTYQVPFYVWGPGVPAGADLYTMNAAIRQVAASYPMTTYAGMQPIRNAEANNLALDLLGLGAIPGSTFDFAQNLVVTVPSVTLSVAGSPLPEAAGVATVTATLATPHTQEVRVYLAFAGTATLASDYTRSDTSMVIAAGARSGSITLTAVQDALYEIPNETIVVDIASVTNGTESGTQQVTVTITDDDPDYAPWIGGYFPTPGDPNALPGADPDHDGMNNHQEYAFGLIPTSGASANPITGPLDKTSALFSYIRRNPSLTGLGYTVMTSTDLLTWTPDVGGSQTPDSPSAQIQTVTVHVGNPPVSGMLFVRVRAQ